MRFPQARLEWARSVIDRFQLKTGRKTYTLGEVIDWAERRDELGYTPADVRQLHEALFSEAARTDTRTDAQGRRIRLRHCANVTRRDESGREVQGVLWAHVDDAPYSFLLESLRQRRAKMVTSARQLQADLDYVNAVLRGRGEREIQLTFDFSPAALDDDAAAEREAR